MRRRFDSCRASNPLDRYKNATPFPVQRLINNDWQWRRSEKSAVLCLRRNSLSRRNPTRDGIAARGRTRCAQRPDAKSIVGSLHSRDWYSRLLACGMDYGSATYQ